MNRRFAVAATALVLLAVAWAVVAPRIDAVGTPSDWALARAVARDHGHTPLPCFRERRGTFCPAESDPGSGPSHLYFVDVRGACFEGRRVFGGPKAYPEEGGDPEISGCVRLADQRPRLSDEILGEDQIDRPVPKTLSPPGPATAG